MRVVLTSSPAPRCCGKPSLTPQAFHKHLPERKSIHPLLFPHNKIYALSFMEAARGAEPPSLPPPEAAFFSRAPKRSTAAPLERKWRDSRLPPFLRVQRGGEEEEHRGSTHPLSRGFIPLRDWFPWQGLLW